MNLIVSNQELSKTFSRLMRKYSHISFAVAWASANTPVFKALVSKPSSIKRGIIGIHFYQTHPSVLDAFINSPSVRFILKPDGVFHPKIYLFWNSDTWEALVGSANMTYGALNRNSEAVIHVSSLDQNSNDIKQQLLSAIELYWQDAKPSNPDSARVYRTVWQSRKPIFDRLSDQLVKTTSQTSSLDSPIRSMSWESYLVKVKEGQFHDVDERLDLLSKVQQAFQSHLHFSLMNLGVRKTIAGLPNTHEERWGWFGSMRGAGYYHQAVINNSKHISRALDEIPLQGFIGRSQYGKYIQEFTNAFPHGGVGVATASRLLALKRPDQFVCVDSRNLSDISKDFKIKSSQMTYDRYWNEIIERIIVSPWWLADRPRDAKDAAIWDGRAAMLDSIFYRE